MADHTSIEILPIKKHEINLESVLNCTSDEVISSKYNHGMLLADSQTDCLPLHVQKLLQLMFDEQQHKNNVNIDSQLLLLMLVYTIAVEMGYITQNEYLELKQELDDVPTIAAYHAANVQRICQVRPTFLCANNKTSYVMQLRILSGNYEDMETSALISLLTVIVNAEDMIVTLTPPQVYNCPGFSTLLVIENYVKKSTANNNIYERLHNLQELSLRLREQIFVPMRNLHMHFTEANVYASLGGLPEMVAIILIEYLSRADIGRLAQVNRRLRAAVKWSRFQ